MNYWLIQCQTLVRINSQTVTMDCEKGLFYERKVDTKFS